ncbi:MAG TPA: MBL fold metallo-hydrolase [Candidatus Polarisedimenticolaceae bacterium]|nr:MBL fold metallo-hydrolase [Candidatus Polarisedimenticolaceae bacterium]
MVALPAVPIVAEESPIATASLMRRLALACLLAAYPVAAAEPVRLVLLGTAGGPTPKAKRAAPAEALEIGDRVYVIDCGNGVGRQLALAGLPLDHVREIFVTHHHSDHTADLTTLPLLLWGTSLQGTLGIHGPPPLARSVKAGLKASAFDIAARVKDEGRTPLPQQLRVDEFRHDGVVFKDDRVTVTAARVDHPPIEQAYAYRFDARDRSIVFSGDTAPSASLVRLARGADVLVHEVLLLDRDEVAAWLKLPSDDPLVRHIVSSHTSYRDVGRIARDAGVKTLVLTHFVPGNLDVDRDRVVGEIRKTFAGEIVLGEDLMEVK